MADEYPRPEGQTQIKELIRYLSDELEKGNLISLAVATENTDGTYFFNYTLPANRFAICGFLTHEVNMMLMEEDEALAAEFVDDEGEEEEDE